MRLAGFLAEPLCLPEREIFLAETAPDSWLSVLRLLSLSLPVACELI